MKKIIKMFLLMLIVITTGCYRSFPVKYRDIYNLVEGKNFDNFIITYKETDLLYQSTASDNKLDKNCVTLLFYNEYYLIDFAGTDLFLYSKESKKTYHYLTEINELESVQSIKEFIHLVEEEYKVKFRLLDYLGFEVIQEVLAEDHSDILEYKRPGTGMAPYPRYIEIPQKNLKTFPLLEEVYNDLSSYQDLENLETEYITVKFEAHSGEISEIAINNYTRAMKSRYQEGEQIPEAYFDSIDEIINLI